MLGQWYPADFITESFPGQFRNWFYALLAMSTMMSDGEPPFKTLLGHGLVRDEHGEEMHKIAGNSIEFNQAAGRDWASGSPMRWLYCRHDPAKNLNFGPGPVERGPRQVPSSSCGTATPSSPTTPGSMASTRPRRRCR